MKIHPSDADMKKTEKIGEKMVEAIHRGSKQVPRQLQNAQGYLMEWIDGVHSPKATTRGAVEARAAVQALSRIALGNGGMLRGMVQRLEIFLTGNIEGSNGEWEYWFKDDIRRMPVNPGPFIIDDFDFDSWDDYRDFAERVGGMKVGEVINYDKYLFIERTR
jgi:hypothetical protein